MKTLEEQNPLVMLFYFLFAAGIPMFSGSPSVHALSLLGAVLYFCLIAGEGEGKNHLFSFLLFLLMALLNPLFNHNGVTVLFVLNDNPVTLEALLYGVNSAAMVVSVLYWFRSFTKLFTDDRLLYLFGNLSPKLACMLSLILRSIPLFKKQTESVKRVQRSLGLYREENAWDDLKGSLSVFSILVTWGLENGIITADSMSARGYGTGRRTFFSRFRFRRSDGILSVLLLLLGGVTCFGALSGALDFGFYPAIKAPARSEVNALSLGAYAVLTLLPSVMETGDRLKWKFLQSEI